MQPILNKVIVKIDKKLQTERREKVGRFYIPSQLMDFQNNLQFGEVISFGNDVLNFCPEIENGCTAIFIHTIEYKVENTNRVEGHNHKEQGDVNYIETDSEGNELRHLSVSDDLGSDLFGVLKNGVIYPCKNIVFCYPQVQKSNLQVINGIFIVENSEEGAKADLEVCSHAITELSNTLGRMPAGERNREFRENLVNRISGLQKDRERLQKQINKIILAELKVAFAPPNELVKSGDLILHNIKHLYPLPLPHLGMQFAIIRDIEYIHGKVIDGVPYPFIDRVIVKQDEKIKKTHHGIVIPDTIDNRPFTGKVISVGVQSDKYEIDLHSGDHVHFSPHGSIEIFIDEVPHLLLHTQNVLAATRRTKFQKKKNNIRTLAFNKGVLEIPNTSENKDFIEMMQRSHANGSTKSLI